MVRRRYFSGPPIGSPAGVQVGATAAAGGSGPGQDPMRAQGYQTQNAATPEDFGQPLYDTMEFPAAGVASLSFFSVPQGQSTTLIRAGAAATYPKTYRDTNMQNANVVPTKMFKFIGVSVAFRHLTEGIVTNPADRDKIRMGGWLQFRIVDKDILFLPLAHIPEVNPFLVGSTTLNSTTLLGTSGGGGNNVPMYVFGVPVTLKPYENFQFNMFFDIGAANVTTTNAVDIIVTLHALMRRPT